MRNAVDHAIQGIEVLAVHNVIGGKLSGSWYLCRPQEITIFLFQFAYESKCLINYAFSVFRFYYFIFEYFLGVRHVLSNVEFA